MVAGVSVTGPGRVRWSIREPSTVSSAGSSISVPPLPPPPSGPGPTPFYRRSPQVHRKCTFSVPCTCCPLARLSRILDISTTLHPAPVTTRSPLYPVTLLSLTLEQFRCLHRIEENVKHRNYYYDTVQCLFI